MDIVFNLWAGAPQPQKGWQPLDNTASKIVMCFWVLAIKSDSSEIVKKSTENFCLKDSELNN